MYVDLLAVIPAANIMVDCAIGSVTDRQIRIRSSSDPMGNSDSKLERKWYEYFFASLSFQLLYPIPFSPDRLNEFRVVGVLLQFFSKVKYMNHNGVSVRWEIVLSPDAFI